MSKLFFLASEYVKAWNTNDVEQIRPLLSTDVTYEDWNGEIKGIEEVLHNNKSALEQYPSRMDVISALAKFEFNTDLAAGVVEIKLYLFLDEDKIRNVTLSITSDGTSITKTQMIMTH